MARIGFFLKEPSATKDTLIYLFLFEEKEKYKLSTGNKIHPKFWNQKKQRARENAQFSEYAEFNASLDRKEKNVLKKYLDLMNRPEGMPPRRDVQKLLADAMLIDGKGSERVVSQETNVKPTLLQFIKSYIDTSVTGKATATIQTYTTTYNHLKGFQTLTNYTVDFDTINLEFYDKFRFYINEVKGIGNNSFGKYVATLKTFMTEAYERELHTNLNFRRRGFKVTREEADNIYLNEDELRIIHKLDLTKVPHLDRVRDLFLIGAYTGLRYSDWGQVTRENIKDGIVKVLVRKTKEWVSLPIHRIIIEILEKYDDNLPRVLSAQKMNEYLKDIGKKAELEEKITKRKNIGAKTKRIKFKKYDLISTHTARRSFATNAFLAGVPTLSIMKLTGHKTEKSFMKYIKMSEEDNARLMMNHPFFTGTN